MPDPFRFEFSTGNITEGEPTRTLTPEEIAAMPRAELAVLLEKAKIELHGEFRYPPLKLDEIRARTTSLAPCWAKGVLQQLLGEQWENLNFDSVRAFAEETLGSRSQEKADLWMLLLWREGKVKEHTTDAATQQSLHDDDGAAIDS